MRFLVASILGSNIFSFLFAHSLRILKRKKYTTLSTTSICIYSACYGSYDSFASPPTQSLDCDIIYFNDIKSGWSRGVHYICSAPISDNPRHSAKFFKICPNLVKELQKYTITVWLDASCKITSKYFAEILLMCTSGDIAMKKHPDRSSIIDEAEIIKINNKSNFFMI